MPRRAWFRSPRGRRKAILLAVLVAAVTLSFSVPAQGDGFEPYSPANEQLRRTSRGLWESQASRPRADLEQALREALRSIKEIEGRTDPQLAAVLATRLKGTWAELERSRAVGGLGDTDFAEEKFQAAEAKFQEVLTQFLGSRDPHPPEQYQAALQTLSEAQALGREARRAVPGLSSDDVLLMRQKRQKLLLEAPKEEGASQQVETGTESSR